MTIVQSVFLDGLDTARKTQDQLIEVVSSYLKPVGTGKIRYLFALPSYPDLRAMYVSDNWSAYDFVFGFVIPGKGKYLNISTIAVKRLLRNQGIETDLVAYGRNIDDYLPKGLCGNHELWQRMCIVHKLDMVPVEVVLRNNLCGSAWSAYQDPANGREVCGQLLPEDLQLFAELSPPFKSPTTKAKTGHDLPLTVQEVEKEHPGLLNFGVMVLETLNRVLANDGIGRIVDTKFEIGRMGRNISTKRYVFGDEMSSDSSRLCTIANYEALKPGELPEFLDKEYGRVWAVSQGIKNLDPSSELDKEEVRSWRPTSIFIEEILDRYEQGFRILSRGHTLEEYKERAMGGI